MSEPAAGGRVGERLHLRFPGICAACGRALAVGTEALHDRRTRTVRCVQCPDPATEDPVDSGIAGASAQHEYEKRKERRATRTKDRFGRRLGGVVLALTDEPQSTRAWAMGALGEQHLASALDHIEGIHVLHDRRVAGTRGNVDHLVIAPAGVFVVDAKRYDGLIRVRDVGGLFRTDERLYVGRRDCSKLADNLGWQVEAVGRALRSIPAESMPPITPVLCFVDGDWPLLRPPSSFRGVRLESERSIRKLLMTGDVLESAEVERLTRLLAEAFPPKAP
jgi:hypothetical protein